MVIMILLIMTIFFMHTPPGLVAATKIRLKSQHVARVIDAIFHFIGHQNKIRWLWFVTFVSKRDKMLNEKSNTTRSPSSAFLRRTGNVGSNLLSCWNNVRNSVDIWKSSISIISRCWWKFKEICFNQKLAGMQDLSTADERWAKQLWIRNEYRNDERTEIRWPCWDLFEIAVGSIERLVYE